jgi:hypothetical protein
MHVHHLPKQRLYRIVVLGLQHVCVCVCVFVFCGFQQIIQSLARQGRAVGRVCSDQRNLHCENKLLYTVTPVSERTLPTFLLMA